MAKKKKGDQRNDSRGYGQSPSAPRSATTATAVSSKQHDGMKSLLDQMKQQQQQQESDGVPNATLDSSSSITVASDRFVSRLQGIVDRLVDFGFTDQHLNVVVPALQYSITLESALDWLCLHLPTMKLPALFTDARLRESLSKIETNDTSLTVLKLSKPKTLLEKEDDEEHDAALSLATLSINPNSSSLSVLSTKDQEELVEQKAWLVQQYQYVEEEEHHGDEIDKIVVQPSTTFPVHFPNQALYDSSATTTVTSTATNANANAPPAIFPEVLGVLSPDEEYLAEQEVALKELEDDVNNEANNYMRTKQEIKLLRSDLKQRKKIVEGIRRRIEKERAKHESANETKEQQTLPVAIIAADEDGEEDGGGFLDLFGGGVGEDDQQEDEQRVETVVPLSSSAQAAPELLPSSPAPPPKPLIDSTISSDWTGATPQKTLEEYCRKQKLPRPKFTKLPHNQGYTLVLNMHASKKKKVPPETTIAYNSDFQKGSSLSDYLATQALYRLEPSLPLYRMFPPVFREIWLSWLREVEDVKIQEMQSRDSAKQERLARLLSLISSQPKHETHGGIVSGCDRVDEELIATQMEKFDTVPEDWDTAEILMDSITQKNATKGGQKLRQEFEKRISTSAYKKMLQIRDTLPMTSFRQEILEMVENNPVTILSAQTGAGKTTQCPQYLLEQAFLGGRGDATQILVTQPRRVAATSVAERVSEEMCEPRIGRWVGYQIRMEAKRSAETKLLFCTTGIVLRRLQDDRTLEGVTHVIVDEVHERQQQTDVLLIALRELLQSTRPDLKVILMSATLDSNLFCSFFGNAPLVNVPGRTFPVSNYHLEDLMDATDYIVEEGSRYALRGYQNTSSDKATLWVTNKGGEKRREVVDLVSQTDVQDVSDMYPGYKISTRRSMDRVNEEVINFDLLEDILSLILCRPDHNSTLLPPEGADLSQGSVLVFLPGLGEIRSITERLEGNRNFQDTNRFQIIPMHSTLSSKDQRRAFVPTKAGCRKIILSTNIAETSVTIPDVVCVVDTGRVREVRRNKRTSTSILVTDWCSKASAKQRAGRAGRVQPGICLKLYSSRTSQVIMKPASEPELRRVPLEEICLSILASGFAKNSMDFLSKAPQPPDEASVKAAVTALEEVGAIEVEQERSSRRIERLTPLGRILAILPVDIRLGKMLIFGALFRCLDKALTIAASLSSQSPFSTFMADANVAKAKQRSFSDPDSDFVTYCNLWESYSDAAARSAGSGRAFCQSNYLSSASLREISDARRNFLALLCGIGLVDRKAVDSGKGNSLIDPSDLRKSIYNENSDNVDLLHAVICAGLYPNVAQLTTGTGSSECTLQHKTERLYFHSSSVNSRKKRYMEGWVVFHEKFGTSNRVSVATTCFVHPSVLLLLGGSVVVKHTQRIVVIDGWIEISMAAQIGVLLKELRKQVDVLLSKMIGNGAPPAEAESMGANLVKILCLSTST